MTQTPMPLAVDQTMINTSDNSDYVLHLATAEMPQLDRDRKERMHEAWKAYRGDWQRPLKVAANQPDDNVLCNRCAPIVDKGVSFLFGQVLQIEPGKPMKRVANSKAIGVANTPVEVIDEKAADFVGKMWGNDDDRMTLLAQIAINGGVCGQTFVKVIPPVGTMKYPRIVPLDPLLVRIVTAPDDCSLVLAYIIEYQGINTWQKRQVICRVDPDGLAGIAGEQEMDDTWTITDFVRKGQAGGWFQARPPELWPYPFPPIFTCQNLPNPNEPWGMPDLSPDIIGENRAINFLQSNISRIVKYHGHPVTYAVGLHAEEIKIGIDDLICLPSKDSKLEKLSAMDNFSGLLAFVEDIRSNMDEQSRVPSVALGRLQMLPRGNISGVSLQLLFQPLIEKTIQKQRLYGKLIRDVSRAGLVITGKLSLDEYEDYDINIKWQNLLPINDLSAAQTGLLLLQLGVSKATVLQEMGYDPDVESEKTSTEMEQEQANAAAAPPAAPPAPGVPSLPATQASETPAQRAVGQAGAGQPQQQIAQQTAALGGRPA